MAVLIVLSDAERLRFDRKIEKTESCWLWTGGSSDFGHGRFRVGGKLQSTHRIAYTLAYGKIPKAKLVLHKCHNPRCVNPEHLYAGTYADNQKDALEAGRSKVPVHLWLDEARVLEIKALVSSGLSFREVGRRTGVNHSTVSSIVKGKTKAWANVA